MTYFKHVIQSHMWYQVEAQVLKPAAIDIHNQNSRKIYKRVATQQPVTRVMDTLMVRCMELTK